MILVIGGAFQGKYEFVKNKFEVSDEKIFDSFHLKMKECFLNGKDRKEFLREIFSNGFEVIISDEIGCGIVPFDKYERLWREEVGRGLCEAAVRCDEVWRVLCGIGSRIK